ARHPSWSEDRCPAARLHRAAGGAGGHHPGCRRQHGHRDRDAQRPLRAGLHLPGAGNPPRGAAGHHARLQQGLDDDRVPRRQGLRLGEVPEDGSDDPRRQHADGDRREPPRDDDRGEHPHGGRHLLRRPPGAGAGCQGHDDRTLHRRVRRGRAGQPEGLGRQHLPARGHRPAGRGGHPGVHRRPRHPLH
ncbi:MAG: hypothetical protein AVDCRST_MAG48-799, partial [uncultured Friedmanniella sp.]